MTIRVNKYRLLFMTLQKKNTLSLREKKVLQPLKFTQCYVTVGEYCLTYLVQLFLCQKEVLGKGLEIE